MDKAVLLGSRSIVAHATACRDEWLPNIRPAALSPPPRPQRKRVQKWSCALGPEGSVSPLAGPGLGVDVDEEFLRAHPATEGRLALVF